MSTSKKPQPSHGVNAAAIHPEDRPESYQNLSSAQQIALQAWIAAELMPTFGTLSKDTHVLKHHAETACGYVTNGQFKGAMLASGYEPANPGELNWRFRARLRDPNHRRVA